MKFQEVFKTAIEEIIQLKTQGTSERIQRE
jgi:hypothetical protein